ncbi:adenylate/guanylate cyclase domain-containing protein [Rhizobium leguminosarum]|uniref:adenylate/guanylate cyclase domain-containing protein n=1 Tax=Rhizobium leguminosarum TaxID=384 RepID=UPI0010314D8C|nr:adenylate/guanylate cyclase domain-containing protein [Rhizobium leguminosarum]TBG08447.1 adenylate/guanylate cyclase domain-containing protein [Rhizobium leguminosarum]
MVKMNELRDELAGEVGTILAKEFAITVSTTNYVPNSSDGAITFPNLDASTQACKLIETCVLYIDIRRSTQLNLEHKPQTVAKLYSAFVRSMTKCARHYGGHVRGIIGDRVMVIFDKEDAYKNAVNTAILMHSTAKYVLNKHFSANEIECGIGIDAGRILATKTGFRRRGVEQYNYKNLVWLGRPANVASKLTDLANKKAETLTYPQLHSAFNAGGPSWTWLRVTPQQFLAGFDTVHYPAPSRLVPKDARWSSYLFSTESVDMKPATPPILMTKLVYDRFKQACPDDSSIKNGWFKKIDRLTVTGYSGDVYGGDVIFSVFK